MESRCPAGNINRKGLQLIPSHWLNSAGYVTGCVVYADVNADLQYTSGIDPAGLTSGAAGWMLSVLTFQQTANLFVQPSNQVQVRPRGWDAPKAREGRGRGGGGPKGT